ncbi:MAG: hypothetical protein IH986_03330, partial [Planctomycetes bacterium]|nr:hypothetical protein [Planctomycetota bacterium]
MRSFADACRHNVRRLRSAGERVATRLARKTAPRTPAFPLLSQVYGCAGLCAFGGALGATWMSSELVFHGASAARVMGVAGSAVCAGVLIALWMVRRLSRGSAPAAAGRGPRAAFSPVGRGSVIAAGETGELEFAASLTGSLILAFGLVWLALVGGTVMMEPYRELLVRNFVLAPWPKTMLLWLPTVLGLATAGAAATTATLALQGWHRLVTGRRSSVTQLWLVMLLGSAAGGAVAAMGSRPAVLVIAALAALFLAGVLAVFRKPVEVQAFESAAHASADDSTRGVPFLLALAAAFGAGAAWLMSLPSGLATAEVFGARCGLLTLAMAGGLLAAHSLRRVRSNVAGLLGLFLVALGFVLPYDYFLSAPGGAATARLVVAGFCAAACITFVARRVGKRAGSVQYALARVGAAVALGLVLAFGLVSGARGGPLGLALPALAALATTGVAGVVAVMDRQLQIPLRLAAMGAGVAWFAYTNNTLPLTGVMALWTATTPGFKKIWRNKVLRAGIAFILLNAVLIYPLRNVQIPLIAMALLPLGADSGLLIGQLVGGLFLGMMMASTTVLNLPAKWRIPVQIGFGGAFAAILYYLVLPGSLIGLLGGMAIYAALVLTSKRIPARWWLRA